MKIMSGFSVLFMVVGITSLLLATSTSSSSSFSGDMEVHNGGNIERATSNNRKLMGKRDKKVVEKVNVEDYHPVDPVPSSKATITNGPIEHGSPLNPFIPKPTPSSPPKPNGP